MAVSDAGYAQATFMAHLVRTVNYLTQQLSTGPTLPSVAQRRWALHTLDVALRTPGAWPAVRPLTLALAPKMEQAGHRQEWIRLLKLAHAYSTAQHEGVTTATLALQLGVLHRLIAQYETGYRYLQESAGRFAQLGLPNEQARALNQQAYLCRMMNRHTEATQFADQALTLLKDDPGEQSYSYFVKGIVALDGRDWPAAIQWYKRSLALRQQVGDRRKLAWGYGNLASALRSGGRYDEAMRAFHQAITLYQEVDDPHQQAITEMNLANLHLLQNQPHQALALYHRAEPLFRQMGDAWHLAAIALNMGMALRSLERWPDAEDAFRTSIDQWARLGNIRNQADALGELAELYLRRQQPDQAMAARSAAQALTAGGRG